MRVEFHHSDQLNDCGQPFYTTVFLEGREVGVFHPDALEKDLSVLIEKVYARAQAETIKEQQNKLKELVGIK